MENTGEYTQAQSAPVMRSWGWSMTKKDGWICPDCAKNKVERATPKP